MSFDLTNKNISDTYQNLLQKTGSNNQLFDLLGNPVTDLTIQGALIAESYIVSQSTIVFSSGSTAFGNSSDDTHNFIGSLNTTSHITASGNISSSGTIIGSSLTITDDLSLRHITASGNISSSGHISASGNIVLNKPFGENLYIQQFVNNNKIVELGSVTGGGGTPSNGALKLYDSSATKKVNLSAQGGTQSYIIPSGITTGKKVGFSIGNFTSPDGNMLQVSGSGRFAGSITASGIISASGDIFSNHINVDGGISSSGDMNFVAPNSNIYHFNKGDKAADFKFSCAGGETFFISGGVLGQVGLGTNTPTTKLQVAGTTTTTNLISTTHITASGEISASGLNHTFGNAFIDNPTSGLGSIFVTLGTNNSKILNLEGHNTILGTPNAQYTFQVTDDEVLVSAKPFRVTNSITASGEISASGTLISNEINTIGHITASGDISASGTITMLSASIGGGIFTSASLASGGVSSYDDLTDVPTNIISSSAQLPSGLVSASSAGDGQAQFKLNGTNVDVNGLGTDGDVTFDTLTLDAGGLLGVGAFSSSAQLPSGIFSSSLQTFTSITASGNISSSGGLQLGGGTFSAGGNTVTDAGIVLPEGQKIYTLESGQYFRNLIHKASDVIQIGQAGTALIDEIRLIPGNIGFTTFYGNTTEVARIDVAGNITASGNISASGTIFASKLEVTEITSSIVSSSTNILIENITSSGDSIFGDTVADTHTFNGGIIAGNITASGNISGSGTGTFSHIHADNFSRTNRTTNQKYMQVSNNHDITFGDIDETGNVVKFTVDDTNQKFEFETGFVDIQGTTDATDASGDTGILRVEGGASIAKKLFVGTNLHAAAITASGNISASGNIISSQITSSGFNLVGSGDAELEVDGHITASGNISSSGTVITNKLQIDVNSSVGTPSIFPKGDTDTGIVFPSANTVSIQAAGTTPELVISQNKAVVQGQAAGIATLEVDGKITSSGFISTLSSITASGDISASGTLIANEIDVRGHITASGNISSSATSTGSFGRLEGDGGGITLVDGNKLNFGSSDDGNIKHTGANFQIQNTTGNIQLINYANDKDITLSTDDGSGGEAAYITLDGSTTRVEIAQDTNFAGHITASGNISGSGATNDLHMKRVFSLDRVVTPEIAEFTNGGGVKITGNITATGNISSSGGTITGGSYFVNSLGALSDSSAIVGSGLDIGKDDINHTRYLSPNHHFFGHITSSGNISASGTIFANDLQLTGSGNLYGSSSYLNIVNDGTAPSELRLNCEENTHYIGIRGPVHSGASSYVLKLPNGTPSDNQILKVNGSPSNGEVTLAWESDGGGGGSVSGDTFATDLRIGRDSDNHVDFTTDNQIDFDIDGETSVIIKKTSDSGSIAVSGSIKVQPQELVPAVSESRLYNKTSANGNVVDDLHFGTAGLTPAYAWVTLDDDGTSGTDELIYGVGSAVTSTAYNMTVVHDSSTNGTRIHSEMDGVYKVTGNFLVMHSTATTMTIDIKVDGSTVHTTLPFVHSAVDPAERTMIYVGTVNSGSYVTATVDAGGSSATTNFEVGSVLLVERLS